MVGTLVFVVVILLACNIFLYLRWRKEIEKNLRLELVVISVNKKDPDWLNKIRAKRLRKILAEMDPEELRKLRLLDIGEDEPRADPKGSPGDKKDR